MNRRHFVLSATSAAAAAHVYGANDRIRVGLVGTGSRCMYLAGIVYKQPGTEIVAACDVYEPRRLAAADKFGQQCRPALEYREVLERKDVDAVVVGTPDHWHVPVSVDAMNASKDVYCEKPVTHKVEEGDRLILAVEKSGRVYASGLQQRSWPHYLQAKQEWDSGKLGRLYFAQSYWYFKSEPHSTPEIDRTKMDWKRFLGIAPAQAFDAHKFLRWRSYWDFGGGGFDDFMTHWIDVVQWFMSESTPVSVQASGIWEPGRRGDAPATRSAVIQYPGDHLATYDGSYMAANHDSGIVLRGTQATMVLTRSGYTIGKVAVTSKQDGTIDNIQNWLDCVRTRAVPKSHVRAAVEAAQTSHMANLSALEKHLISGRPAAANDSRGFEPVFNGRDLSGWHISEVNHHGATKSWHVENGVVMGSQEPAGVGGILLTDRRFRNFEVEIELKPDWDCDGGLFLRSNEKGQAYQVMLDYLTGGNVGGIYGEKLEGVKAQGASGWQNYWRTNNWNTLRARIEGEVPHIQVWLNGYQITDFRDTANHLADGATDGMIAVQVHRGDRWAPGGWHRFRSIAVKELS